VTKKNVIYRRAASVVCRRIAGEYLLVPVTGELAGLQVIFTLNPAGHCIWESLAEERTAEDLQRRLAERFDVGAAQARRDVDGFLGSLTEEGLVTTVTA
jgi:sensor domain CHASE-containing protein